VAGHNGVSRAGGIVYTYNHADKAPGPGAQYYKVTCYIDFVKRPIHINRYYVPGAELDRFLTEQAETGEVERAKERQGTRTDIKETFPEGSQGQTRDKVAEKDYNRYSAR
jgi:hypothetical protein